MFRTWPGNLGKPSRLQYSVRQTERGEGQMRMSRISGVGITFSLTVCMALAQGNPQRGTRAEQQQQPAQQPSQQNEQAQPQRRLPPPEEKSSVTHHSARIGGQQ